MPALPTRELKIATIIDKTLGVVEHTAAAALLYVAVLSALNIAVAYFTLEMTAPMQQLVIGLGKFALGIAAAYFLLEAMVRKTGLRATEEETFLAYCALSVLYTLGVLVGFLLIIFPGLLVMARWSIAQPLLVARGEGVMKSLGESWERTRGNEFPILVAAFAMLLPLIAILIACSVFFEREDLIGISVTQIATSATSVVSLATGVALYGLIMAGRTAAAPST